VKKSARKSHSDIVVGTLVKKSEQPRESSLTATECWSEKIRKRRRRPRPPNDAWCEKIRIRIGCYMSHTKKSLREIRIGKSQAAMKLSLWKGRSEKVTPRSPHKAVAKKSERKVTATSTKNYAGEKVRNHNICLLPPRMAKVKKSEIARRPFPPRTTRVKKSEITNRCLLGEMNRKWINQKSEIAQRWIGKLTSNKSCIDIGLVPPCPGRGGHSGRNFIVPAGGQGYITKVPNENPGGFY